MQEIIAPIDRNLILKELGDDKFVRITNNGSNEIYKITAQNSPNIMKEIGRLREVTFRRAGGGTGKEIDIDEFDICEKPYQQLIVWDPRNMQIIGGYRYILCKDAAIDSVGMPYIATSHLFNMSEKFIKEYLPLTIELGRSFVQPDYQPTINARKGLFSLDNLWDGLGTLAIDNPEIKYFFGKVTMYPHFDREARDIILYFLYKYFPDTQNLVAPIHPVKPTTDVKKIEQIFHGGNYGADYKLLISILRNYNESIPPLVNAYMNLTSTMRTFGTAINDEFGDVEETGILVTIRDIYENKKERHLSTYKKE